MASNDDDDDNNHASTTEIDSDDDDFDVKNCRKCGLTPDQAAGSNKVCSKCKSVSYCSIECQVSDWGRHKGACKWLKKEREHLTNVSSKMDDALHNPRERAFLQAMNPSVSDLDADIQSDARRIRLQGLIGALNSKEEFKYLSERYKDADPTKRAKRYLRAVMHNFDRPHLQFEIYTNMDEEVNHVTWNACFADADMETRFFSALCATMENDANHLDNLPPGVQGHDVALAPPSLYPIPRIFFEEKGSPASPDGVIQVREHLDRAVLFFDRCWVKWLQLSVSIATNMHRGVTPNGMSETHGAVWSHICTLMSKPEVARAVLTQDSQNAGSPSITLLRELLSIHGGENIETFMQYVYGVVALLVLHVRRGPGSGISDGLESRMSNVDFFRQVALSLAGQALEGHRDLAHVIGRYPLAAGML
jgi:hypothetical protein